MTAKHIIFRGSVQGVGFRYTARSIARRFFLTGYVKNLPDGSVEMFAQGPDEDLAACIDDIGRYFHGYIRSVVENSVPQDPRFSDFTIAY